MKYTEEIFNILSKGGFISSNSVSTQVKRLYDAIEKTCPIIMITIKASVFIWKVVMAIIILSAKKRKLTWNANWKLPKSGLII